VLPATENAIAMFLADLLRLSKSDIDIAHQRKTRDFLDELDYDKEDVVTVCRQLRREHYSYGPNQNDWGAGAVWHFGIAVGGYPEVYVKLCLVKDGKETRLTVMSFHPSEKKMTFPYAK
jgi:hypothetical protein